MPDYEIRDRPPAAAPKPKAAKAEPEDDDEPDEDGPDPDEASEPRLRAVWKYAKRTAGFPIGERFAAISITAAIWDARVTFVVVLAWGVLGIAYNVAGRVIR